MEVGKPSGCMGVFPGKEGGIQVLAGLAPCSQTVGSLLRTHWSAKMFRIIDPKVPVKIIEKESVLCE